MIFKNITIFFRNVVLFASPTDDFGKDPTEDSEGSKSFIYHRDERMIRVVRRFQCFVRLGMDVSDLTEFMMHELGR